MRMGYNGLLEHPASAGDTTRADITNSAAAVLFIGSSLDGSNDTT